MLVTRGMRTVLKTRLAEVGGIDLWESVIIEDCIRLGQINFNLLEIKNT